MILEHYYQMINLILNNANFSKTRSDPVLENQPRPNWVGPSPTQLANSFPPPKYCSIITPYLVAHVTDSTRWALHKVNFI